MSQYDSWRQEHITSRIRRVSVWSNVKAVAVAASVVVAGGGAIVAQEAAQRKADVKPVVSRQIRPDAAVATTSLARNESSYCTSRSANCRGRDSYA